MVMVARRQRSVEPTDFKAVATMPLNNVERTFLRGYLQEILHSFAGPAVAALNELKVEGQEIVNLLNAAVDPEEGPELEAQLAKGVMAPWWDRDEILHRETEFANESATRRRHKLIENALAAAQKVSRPTEAKTATCGIDTSEATLAQPVSTSGPSLRLYRPEEP